MIILPILTNFLVHFSWKDWENVLFELESLKDRSLHTATSLTNHSRPACPAPLSRRLMPYRPRSWLGLVFFFSFQDIIVLHDVQILHFFQLQRSNGSTRAPKRGGYFSFLLFFPDTRRSKVKSPYRSEQNHGITQFSNATWTKYTSKWLFDSAFFWCDSAHFYPRFFFSRILTEADGKLAVFVTPTVCLPRVVYTDRLSSVRKANERHTNIPPCLVLHRRY